MKARVVAYWISTVIVAVVMIASIVGVMKNPDAIAGMQHLGYPIYFLVVLSTWKVLGGLTLLAPKLPRLKEWAYAGAIFDFTGASMSHASVGDDIGHIVVPLVIAVIALASWALRPQSRMVGSIVRPPAGSDAASALT
ncbi:MAG: hypothetical protein JWO86_6147 [Myxococcaceae bacterium]|jgi:hypothetical protein|nr:hypothetical protein [Myxococcaceae bacterium]